MSEIVVADSSCLIGLSKIGQLEVLHQLCCKGIAHQFGYDLGTIKLSWFSVHAQAHAFLIDEFGFPA